MEFIIYILFQWLKIKKFGIMESNIYPYMELYMRHQ